MVEMPQFGAPCTGWAWPGQVQNPKKDGGVWVADLRVGRVPGIWDPAFFGPEACPEPVEGGARVFTSSLGNPPFEQLPDERLDAYPVATEFCRLARNEVELQAHHEGFEKVGTG